MFTRNDRTSMVQVALRWTARALSVASTAVLLLFVIGEPFNVSRITAKEWIGFVLFPVGIVAGFAVAWWKEGLGGAFTIASVVVFCLIFGNLGRAWAFFVFAFPGLLFLISGLLSNFRQPKSLQT